MRRLYRLFLWVLRRWANWTAEAAVFTMLALTAPVLNRGLWRTWRLQGLAAFLHAAGVAMVVYTRLLLDRRSPALGKFLLFFAVAYGVAPGDLLPDRYVPLGLVDDIILIVLASRSFVRMCDDALVYEHAVHVAQSVSRRR